LCAQELVEGISRRDRQDGDSQYDEEKRDLVFALRRIHDQLSPLKRKGFQGVLRQSIVLPSTGAHWRVEIYSLVPTLPAFCRRVALDGFYQ
jgi:hypothetical protein